MTLRLLFVYGTLMRGFDHPMARHLAANADYRGTATCRGRLYDLGSYPGLTLSAAETEIVHGDLYELPDDPALLAALDAYEGCGASDEAPTLYVRSIVDVVCNEAGPRRAWTYLFQPRVVETQRIISGRFTAP